jgi:hypothetical protein
MSTHENTDKSAGFTGFILGAIVIFVILFSIVRLTNAHYANEKAEAGAEAPK